MSLLRSRGLAAAASGLLLGVPLVVLAAPSAAASVTGNIASIALGQVGSGPCGSASGGYAGYDATGTAQTNSCAAPGTNAGQSHGWCADFAGWVWQQAGVTDLTTDLTYDGNFSLDDGASSFYNYGQKHNTLHTSSSYVPQPGDAIVYNYGINGNPANWASHVAIVTSVNSNGTVNSVGGNSGGGQGAVQTDTGEPAPVGDNVSWGDEISAYISPVTPPSGTTAPTFDGYGSASSSSSTVVDLKSGTVSHFTRDANGHVWDSSETSSGSLLAYDMTANSPHVPVTGVEPVAAAVPGGGIDLITTQSSSGDVINTPISSSGVLGPTYDLTANAGKSGGIPATSGTPSIVLEQNGTAVVVDRASTGNVWSISWGSAGINAAYDWTANTPHTPDTDGNPTAAVTPGGDVDIISTNAANGDVVNSPWNVSGKVLGPTYDLTANAGDSGGIPAADGDASIAVEPDGTAVVADRESDGEVWTIAWDSSNIGPAYDWTANKPHTPLAGTDPALVVTASGGVDIITTNSSGGDVVNSPWNFDGTLGPTYDLTANAGESGGIAAASGSASIAIGGAGTAYVFDKASDGEVWSTSWTADTIGPAYDWTANNPHTPEAD